jgi:hypothetical protein
MEFIINIFFYLIMYILIDYFLGDNIKGKYYLIHSINNMYIVYLTLPDLFYTYQNFTNFYNYQSDITAVILTYALHLYHIIVYFNKLRFDDWLHHILMCGVALPCALMSNSGSLLGHSLFFLTGLPGGIDYFLMFLNRNNYIKRITEKKINCYLNLWIRCPGCIAHSTLTILAYNMFYEIIGYNYIKLFSCWFTTIIVYWNGIYFMNQVVENYTLERSRIKF